MERDYPEIGIHRPCSNWIARGSSSTSDKDLLFKSNVLRKLLIFVEIVA